MKNTKLSLRKTTITKLNNLSNIKGGSLVTSGVDCLQMTSTKTNQDILNTEEGCP